MYTFFRVWGMGNINVILIYFRMSCYIVFGLKIENFCVLINILVGNE